MPIIVNRDLMYYPSETEHDGILVTSTMCLRLSSLEKELAQDRMGKQQCKHDCSLISRSCEPRTWCRRPCGSLIVTTVFTPPLHVPMPAR